MFDAGRVSVKVSSRDLKYNDGDVVEVKKFNSETGKNEVCGTMTYSSPEYILKNFLTQEELNIIGCQMFLVKCQNFVRQSTKEKSKVGQVSRALKTKGLTDEQMDKVLAYIEKQ